jgi:two-component system, OmpR family, response regulator
MNEHSPRNATIMIVEDEPDVARIIEQVLADFGFQSVWCRSGGELFRRLPGVDPDLCIIDLGLPDMDGLEVMGRVRAMSRCGILILTGRTHVSDKVMGLELGADDYVSKPFEPRELVARIRSILRRRENASADGANGSVAEFAGWCFNIANNTLMDEHGREQVLSTSEAELLKFFLKRPNRILQRDALFGSRDFSPTDRNIDVRVSRLRRRLESERGADELIKTIYGAGYLFSATVVWRG